MWSSWAICLYYLLYDSVSLRSDSLLYLGLILIETRFGVNDTGITGGPGLFLG